MSFFPKTLYNSLCYETLWGFAFISGAKPLGSRATQWKQMRFFILLIWRLRVSMAICSHQGLWSLASFVYELIFKILYNLRTFKVWSNKNNVKNLQDNIHLVLCLYNKKWISINNANVHNLHLLSSTNPRSIMFIMFNSLEFN
jgi:hypothetical protein